MNFHGVEYTSPFGPVLAGIFMVGLEARITATVTDRISHWKRYIDDKKKNFYFVFIKNSWVEHVLVCLDPFYQNIPIK